MIHLDTCNISLSDNKYVDVALSRGEPSKFGPFVAKFEKRCKEFLGVKHAVATNSGTTALLACLLHIGVKDKEVIIPALTFKATLNAVLLAGGIPVVVDVNHEDWTINNNEVRLAITKKTKAVIPVHLYGHVCNMKILSLIIRNSNPNIVVIEDACESFGSPNQMLGDYQCYSFNGNKTITTGQGGMITSNKHDLETIRQLIDSSTGVMNGRMANLNSALGLSQMERIDEFINKKYKIRKWYKKYLPKNTVFQENNGVPWMTCINGFSLYGEYFPKTPFRPVFKPLANLHIATMISGTGCCLPSSTLNTKSDIQEYCNGIF